jgi:hypothetical protein
MSRNARPPFLAVCSCGRARTGAALAAVMLWADWHRSVGCEGIDHVTWIGPNDPPRPCACCGRLGDGMLCHRCTYRPLNFYQCACGRPLPVHEQETPP